MVRFEPKDFRQRRPNGTGWDWRLGDIRRVLYRLPAVLEASAREEGVLVVEGERDVHAAEKAGVVATCNPGGAGKWRSEYAEALRGAQAVVVADRDQAGRDHAQEVVASLRGIAKSVDLVEPAVGKDLADHLAAGKGIGQLSEVREPASDEPTVRLEKLTARETCALPDPPNSEELLGPLLGRRNRLVIGGQTGEGKTSLGLAILRSVVLREELLGWRGAGGRALVLDAEQGLKTVKRRLQEAGLANSDDVDYVRVPDGLSLDSDADHIAAVDGLLAEGNYSVVLADPLYKLHTGESNAEREAVDLMRRFDGWRERYGFALILPAHCRKPPPGVNKFTMNEIAGSGGYLRGAEVVIGLQKVRDGYSFLHLLKDRDGDLPVPAKWGLLFDREQGFRRDPDDENPRQPATEAVRELLKGQPGMTCKQVSEASGFAQDTVRKALKELGAEGKRSGSQGEKVWSMPEEAVQ